MRIIILGGTGMLGHMLWQHFSLCMPDTYTTIRHNRNRYEKYGFFKSKNVIDSLDVNDFKELTGVLKCVRPDIILNCIGVTKRRKEANVAIQSITINALFPHKLAAWGYENSAKVINFSTDCVFDGDQGNYDEESLPNATDLYGKTKALGEIQGTNALTLRSSFIGTELDAGTELLEWFLSQTGTVKGYKNAIYSGFTTLELSRIVENILINYPTAHGIYNISSDAISKYDLLMLIREKMCLNVDVVPDENFCCKRNLDSTKFRNEFDYKPPTWEAMIEELSNTFKAKGLGE